MEQNSRTNHKGPEKGLPKEGVDNGRIVEGGACDQIVFDIKEMMSYLSSREAQFAMNKNRVRFHTRHWRIRAAIRVCSNCPAHIWLQCLDENPTIPGVRAGQYLSYSQSRSGMQRVNIHEISVEDQAV